MKKNQTTITVEEIDSGTQTLIEHPGVEKQLFLQSIITDDGLEFNQSSLEDIEEFCMLVGGTKKQVKDQVEMYVEFIEDMIANDIARWTSSVEAEL